MVESHGSVRCDSRSPGRMRDGAAQPSPDADLGRDGCIVGDLESATVHGSGRCAGGSARPRPDATDLAGNPRRPIRGHARRQPAGPDLPPLVGGPRCPDGRDPLVFWRTLKTPQERLQAGTSATRRTPIRLAQGVVGAEGTCVRPEAIFWAAAAAASHVISAMGPPATGNRRIPARAPAGMTARRL
jgi:hypothetical protein